MTRVAWIGLGAMGGPMAARVAAAGLRVSGFDVDSEQLAAAGRAGVTPTATIHAAARDAAVAALMIATPEQGEVALLGTGGLLSALEPGATVLVTATVGPRAVERWTRACASRGVDLVDAPVSGGVARAASGTLLAMVSGASDALRRAEPVIAAFADHRPTVGDVPGDGQRFKVINQLLCGVHIAAAAEALALAEALGLDPEACWRVLRHGAAASFMLEDRGARMLDRDRPVRSALDIFVKDMGLVLDAASERGYDAPLATTAKALYDAGRAGGLGRADDSALIEVLRAGRVVRSAPRLDAPGRGLEQSERGSDI